MGKIIKLVLVIAILVGVGYIAMMYMGEGAGTPGRADNPDAPRVEEKYGFTSQGVDGD